MLMLPNCCLPEGVMVDILSRLPVKSLLRFRSVCKHWYSLLTSPDFITLQLNQINGDKLLTESDLLVNYRWYIVPALYVYNREDNISFDLPLHLFPFDSRCCVKIVGTCNGLVCALGIIINCGPALVLWNPATRQFRYLDLHPNTRLRCILFVGFGFLTDTNDYKVVVFQCCSTPLGSGRIMVFVYSFSSDSWRLIEVAAPVSRFYSRSITLNGVFYWIERLLNKTEIIVSFDLRDEVFRQMTVPDSCGFGGETRSELVVLKGSLSVIFYSKRVEMDRCFEIWVMTEDGVQESWTRLFTVGPFSGIVEPVGSWKNGELIFRYPKSRSNVMFSYDPWTLETQYFAVPEARGLIRAFNYVESLEFVDGGDKRNSRRCAFTRGDARIQMPCENVGDLVTPSNDFVWDFAIPGPKNSGMLHCRLCGELFYRGDIAGLKLHLAHRNTRGSPCPYVSNDIRDRMRMHLQVLHENFLKKQHLACQKSRASSCACVSADIIMGKVKKNFQVLKEKLIKKRAQRAQVAERISLPQHEDDHFDDDEIDDDDFDDDEFDDNNPVRHQ